MTPLLEGVLSRVTACETSSVGGRRRERDAQRSLVTVMPITRWSAWGFRH